MNHLCFFGNDVRTWHEHEDAFERVAGILKDRGLSEGRIGFEETVRYFVAAGLGAMAPNFEIVAALPVTLGCRMYKSPAEIALMTIASEVTMNAFSHVYTHLEAGMTPGTSTR